MTSIAYETVIIDLCIKCLFAELISNETQLTFLWAEKSLAIAPLLNEKEVTELLENATPKTHKVSFSRILMVALKSKLKHCNTFLLYELAFSEIC